LILAYHWICPRSTSERTIDAISENTLRVDIAQHITKHNLLLEEQNVRNPAFWAETTLQEFYLEVSYPTDIAHPDRTGNILPSDKVLMTGFPADPLNQRMHDPSRLHTLLEWFEELRSNELYDVTSPQIVNDAGVIPLKYSVAGSVVPSTKAVQAWVLKKQKPEIPRRPLTLQEVVKLMTESADLLAEK
jgi:hypothetical protein